MSEDRHDVAQPSPLPAVLALTFLASLGTGMLWNAIPFITKKEYGFNERDNFLLFLVIGFIYIGAALTAGPVQRRLQRWASPRTVLAALLLTQATVCTGPIAFTGPWVPWIVSIVFSATSALLWPIVESFLTSGRHGPHMRWALGWWNVSWTFAVAVPLWLMAPLMKHDTRLAIVALGACLGAGLIPLLWFRARPGAHDHEQSRAHVTGEYPLLLHSARVMLPLSYVLLSAVTPLLPYLLPRLHVELFWQTPAAATWAAARVVAIAIMWRITFWHGRWGTLLLGAAGMVIGFALTVAAPHIAILLLGLALLGSSLGVVYYCALYYAMSVGRGAVDAGGKHEALIGSGYCVGPMAGLAAIMLSQALASEAITFQGVLIALVWTLVGLGMLGAARPYFTARQRRKAALDS